jgi:hypothetical protein
VLDPGVIDESGDCPQQFAATPGHEKGNICVFVEKPLCRIEVFKTIGNQGRYLEAVALVDPPGEFDEGLQVTAGDNGENLNRLGHGFFS